MILSAFSIFAMACFAGLLSSFFKQTPAVGKTLYVIIACILILFVATRGLGSDQDSIAYANYFNFDDYAMSRVAEPTFLLISRMARAISLQKGLFWLFLAYAVIGVTIKFIAINKLTELKWLSVIVYISSYYLLHDFTQIRAGVASGLLLLAIKPIADRNIVKFLGLIFAASLFHYSAAVALPLYFLGNSPLDKKTILVLLSIIPLGTLIRLSNFDILTAIPIELVRIKIDTYSAVEKIRDLKLNVFNALYLTRYAMLYLFMIFSKSIQERSPYFPILIKVYAISMFSYLALSQNAVFAMRISELFGIVEIILVPLLFYSIKPRILPTAFILIFAAVSMGFNIYWAELVRNV